MPGHCAASRGARPRRDTVAGGWPARVAKRDDCEPRSEAGRPDGVQNLSVTETYAKRIADRLRLLRDGYQPQPPPKLRRDAPVVAPRIRLHEPVAPGAEPFAPEFLAPEPVAPQPVAPEQEAQETDPVAPEPGPVALEPEQLPSAIVPEDARETPPQRESVEPAAPTEATSSPDHRLLAAEHLAFEPQERRESPDTFEAPPGPTPPRVRSPTARYWSRPHWQDVAAAAAGESIRAPERTLERQETEWRPPGSRRVARSMHLPLTPGLSTGLGCPYLGLGEDPSTHFTFPDPEHLCFALGRSAAVDLVFQGTHCLTKEYPHCARFFAAEERSGRRVELADDPLSPFHLVTPELVPLPDSATAHPRSQAVRWLIGLIVLLLILAATAGLLGAFPAGLTPAGPSGTTPAVSLGELA